VLHDSGNFTIVPTKGALIPGWLLVVAKRHALCAGALSILEQEELKSCLSSASNIVCKSFGTATIFEHGPWQAETTLGCGIDHVHIHIAPLKFSLRRAVSERFPTVEWKPLPGISGTQSLFESQTDYGLVQEPNERMYWCTPPSGVNQLFRRVIAAEMGIPDEFDYRTNSHIANVLQTLAVVPQIT
jgi:diadenosine tetraphosphate (Ap4A) HIT family hydrolase